MRTALAHSETKEKLVEAAYDLMIEKGFTDTSVEDVCEAAGVTKGSFFHYFQTKEDLGKEVIEWQCCNMQKIQDEAPFRLEKDPLKRLYGRLDFAIKMAKSPMAQKGCVLGAFAQELSESHPKIRRICKERFDQWALSLKEEIDQAKAKYAPRAKWNTHELAEHFIAVLEGSLILAKAKQNTSPFESGMKHFKQYIKNLFDG